jgi:hypothetical protein
MRFTKKKNHSCTCLASKIIVLHKIINLYLIHGNYNREKLISRRRYMCIYHVPAFYTGCIELFFSQATLFKQLSVQNKRNVSTSYSFTRRVCVFLTVFILCLVIPKGPSAPLCCDFRFSRCLELSISIKAFFHWPICHNCLLRILLLFRAPFLVAALGNERQYFRVKCTHEERQWYRRAIAWRTWFGKMNVGRFWFCWLIKRHSLPIRCCSVSWWSSRDLKSCFEICSSCKLGRCIDDFSKLQMAILLSGWFVIHTLHTRLTKLFIGP